MCGTRNEIAKVVLSHTLRMPNEGSSFLGERCSTSFGGCKIRPKTGASETLPTADDYVPTLFCFFKVMEAFKKKELGHAWISSIQVRTTAAIVIYGPRKLRLPLPAMPEYSRDPVSIHRYASIFSKHQGRVPSSLSSSSSVSSSYIF